MTKKNIWISPLLLIVILLMLTNSCKKDDPVIKKDVVITWANPADISIGIALSATQLNATADVAGTFTYTPAIGTVLNVGANQNLKVDFTPTDAVNYNTATKTVTINVTEKITVTDIDGNIYHTVAIGTQTWMVENLKTTKYRNGDPITNLIPWQYSTDGAYCDYDNMVANSDIYGRLYNYAAITDSRDICPVGWHIPTNDEWLTLINFLGGVNEAGGKLKEIGNTYWNSPNTGATNESGFTALPGGARWDDSFGSIHEIGAWWSSTEKNMYFTWCWQLWHGGKDIYDVDYSIGYGLSIRCVKDDW